MSVAGVAHPVGRHLAKVEVASSSLVTRSIKVKTILRDGLYFLVRETTGYAGGGAPQKKL